VFSHHLLTLLPFFAQTEPVPLTWPDILRSVIVAAPVVAFMSWWINHMAKENQRLQDELRATSEKTLAMAEKAIPALVEATRTLGEVRAAMDTPHRQGGGEIDRLVRQLEHITNDMQRGK
jgi:DNA-directed RNA polymerase subunit L